MSAATSKMPDARPKLRKSGPVIPHKPKWHQRLAAWIIWLAVSAISATIRYRLHDPHGYMKHKDFSQTIFCIWHNRLALCMKIYFKFARERGTAPGLAGLVSASRDGALLTAVFERFAVQPVRGSSSRRGGQALLELTTWAQRGYDLAITPDGPRGPRYVVADGAVTLAQVTALPLVPASYHLNWKIEAKSWDGFQIPLPFARCDIYIGQAMRLPRETTDAEREEFRKQLETKLRSITQD